MTFFSSLDDAAAVRDALTLNKPAGRALIDYHTAVMRGDSPLTEAERELVAAYVSGLNACEYCHGVHAATARAYGMDATMLTALVEDPELAAAPDRLRPLLRFARKLTLDQAKMATADAEAVYAAGWSEQALHDLVNVTALFNFMNRFVHGHGLELQSADLSRRGEGLKNEGYAPLLAWLE